RDARRRHLASPRAAGYGRIVAGTGSVPRRIRRLSAAKGGTMRIAYLLIGILLASASFTADAQQRYRWVDENGVTRISDRIPPSANDKRIEVLNARGMVVRVIEPKRELSAEERAAAEAERIAAENAKAAAAEQARRD